MIAGKRRLFHGSLSICIKTREKDCRLHLRARDGTFVVHRAKTPFARQNGKRQEAIRVASSNRRSHAYKRLNNPPHGTA